MWHPVARNSAFSHHVTWNHRHRATPAEFFYGARWLLQHEIISDRARSRVDGGADG